MRMREHHNLHKAALSVTRWIGSPQSIVVHTIVFVLSFGVAFAGLLPFDRMLLILTTILSLEAIYLALFIQMTVNHTTASVEAVSEDIEEIQEDVEEIQKDVDELQEDVEEMSEEEIEEEKREADHQKALDTIQQDLRKLLADIERLKVER